MLGELVVHGYGRTDISAVFAFLFPQAANLPSPHAVGKMVEARGYRLAPNPRGPVPEWFEERLADAGAEVGRYLPGPRREVVRNAVVAASFQFGLPIAALVGTRAIRSPRAVAARKHIIAALYDPATAGRHNFPFAYGISEIGRVLGLHHATVLSHVGERRGGA